MTTTLSVLEKLIGFDTTSGNSNLELSAYVDAFLRECGFRVHRIEDPTGEKTGLYAQIGPDEDGGVLLSAHTDVVPVDGQNWTKDPFRLTRDGRRLFGRGTTDMKGFVASSLALAKRAAATDLREPLKIVLSYDEEIGCVGLQRMLDRLAPMVGMPRACIVGEPTQMQIATGHKGKAALRATCHGQAGHSALAPNFANALYMATDFVSALRQLQKAYAETGQRDEEYDVPYTTLHVGLLQSGTALNMIPERARMTFEYRHLAQDHSETILGQIREAANNVARRYENIHPDARIDIEQYNAYPGLETTHADELVSYVQDLAQRKGTTKVAFGTEAGFFSDLGIPTVVCGPGSMSGQGHKPDEFIEVDQLAACDAMMDRLLDDLRR